MPGINILSLIGQAIIKSIVSMFVSFLFQALIQAVFGVRGGDFNFKAFEQIIRSPVAPTRIIYGQKLVAGPLMFAESTDGDKFLHLVVAHAAHECHDFTDLYVADQRVPLRDMNGDEVNATDFAGFVRRTIHLGSPNQVADSDLVADVGIWTSDHRLRGLCYGRYRLKANEVVFRELEQPPRVEVIGLQAVPSTNTVGVTDVRINEPLTGKGEPFIPFPSGIPNLRILIRGRKVWDPRDAGLAIAASSFLTAGQVEIETVSDHGKSVGDSIFIAGHAQEQENVIFGEYVVEAVGGGRLLTIGQVTDTITGVGTGGTLYDMKFHHNPVLCILDYLVNKDFGRASPESFLNLTQIIASANTCDEQVVLTTKGNFFTADSGDNLLSRTAPSFPINTGSSVQLTTNDTLPAPLAVETEYFYVHRGNLTEFGVATSYVNAVRGNFITITDNGSGIHAVTRFSQPRYTCNGAFTTDAAPINIIEDLLTSCAGNLVNVAGKFHINVGEPAAVTFTLETSHQRGEIEVEADSDRRGKFNRVSGVFVSPDNFWQASDFPPVKRQQFVEADGLELNRDIELRFTNDQVEAQRIATIHLLCSRFAISTNVLVNLHPMTVAPWDVIAFNNSALSWTAKEFRVLGWAMVPDGQSLGLMMDMVEYDSSCYVWTNDEAQLAIPPPLPDINPPSQPPEPDFDGGCRVNGMSDSFIDLSGIDEGLSSGFTHDVAGDFLKAGAFVDFIPVMTSNSAPEGIAAASSEFSSSFRAFKAMDDFLNSTRWLSALSDFPPPNLPAWIRYKFDTATLATAYRLWTESNPSDHLPRSWLFQGSQDGSIWVTLDSQVDIVAGSSAWPGSSWFRADFENEVAYLFYRFFITKVRVAEGTTGVGVQEMEIGDPAATIISKAPCPARFAPNFADIFILEEDEPDEKASVLNVNIKAFASRDGGATFTEGTLIEDIPNISPGSGSTIRQISARAVLTDQPAGSSMVWKIVTVGTQVRYHAVDMFWDR